MRRRVIFRKSKPVAASRRRIMFLGEPVPRLLDDPLAGHDLSKAVTGEQHDIMCRACVDGGISVTDMARVSEAWFAHDAMPVDLVASFAKALP
jgi:hypothetical protein